MLTIANPGLLAMVVVPLVSGAAALVLGQRAPRHAGRVGALVAGLGFALAVLFTVEAGTGEAIAVAAPVELAVDQLAAVLLLLVFGVSAVVQSYAVRYLAGDPRAFWFVGGAGLLTGASAGLVTATTLVGMAVFWTMAGAALCVLLGTYRHIPAARDGVRRTVTAFVIGDLALWVAVVLATATWGRIDLRGSDPGRFGGPVLAVVAILVVIAALSRSAQIPFHRWLPATLAAPTPVSALLHAGVVNAGGILLIRFAPLTADDAARALTILAGAVTMAYGAVIMLVKPDVKGALVNSTTAQMGFMVMTCGLGLWAAAVIHLVAHGFYKSTLFLSSGSAVAARRRAELLPPVGRASGIHAGVSAVTSIVLPAAALGAAVLLVPNTGAHAAEHALLIFAFVTGAAATWGWLKRRPGIKGALLAAAVLVPTAIAYVAAISAVSGYLEPALPPSTLPVLAVWAITAVALIGLGVLGAIRTAPGAVRVQHLLYTNALTAGTIPVPSVQPTGARL